MSEERSSTPVGGSSSKYMESAGSNTVNSNLCTPSSLFNSGVEPNYNVDESGAKPVRNLNDKFDEAAGSNDESGGKDDEDSGGKDKEDVISDITDLSHKMSQVTLDSDDVHDDIGVTESARKVLETDLNGSYSDWENSEHSQDSAAEDESSCSSLITNLPGKKFEVEFVNKDNGKGHFRRKKFAQGPSRLSEKDIKQQLLDLKNQKDVKDDKHIVESLEKFKDEYIEWTRGTNRSLKQLKKKRAELRDLWQVKFMPKDKVCEKIRGFYQPLKEKTEQQYCFTFELEKETFYVDELECYMLKGKERYSCEYENERTRKLFVRIDCLLVLIHELLEYDMSVNIRWIPYAFKEVFKTTIDVEKALEIICKGIGCTRDSLNIFASAKGKIAGDIRFKTTKKGSYSTYCEAGVSIEPRAVVPEDLVFTSLTVEDPLLILVVEKITIFQILVDERIHKRFRCIIITGSGMPDVATRTLLKKVQKRFQIPVVALTDHNAGGFLIYLTYLCGSENMAYENLSTPDIKWLGLSPSDLIENNILEGKEEVGLGRLETIMKKNFVKNSSELAEELDKMKTKVDLESLMDNGVKYLTEIYLPLKFQELVNGCTYRSKLVS